MYNPNIPVRQFDDQAIEGTVNDMLAERMPGTERHTRPELESLVRRVHNEAVERFLGGTLTATEAPAYEWRRIVEELRKG